MLKVSSVQRSCVYDGDGVRTTVFLHGCNLRCPWCCNPETLSDTPYMLDHAKCDALATAGSGICRECELRGGKRLALECPFAATTPIAKEYTAAQLYELCIADREIYNQSDGGVTFSGGEPLLQAGELKPLFEMLKRENINMAVETTLMADKQSLQAIIPFINQYIIDLKLQPIMYLGNPKYENHLKKMLSVIGNIPQRFRMVFIDNMMVETSKIIDALRRLDINQIELLACHSLAEVKYRKLRQQFRDFKADSVLMQKFAAQLNESGITTSCLSI